jgi:hypothetical protein
MVGAGAAATILAIHHDLPAAALALVTAGEGRDGAETRRLRPAFVLSKVIPRRASLDADGAPDKQPRENSHAGSQPHSVALIFDVQLITTISQQAQNDDDQPTGVLQTIQRRSCRFGKCLAALVAFISSFLLRMDANSAMRIIATIRAYYDFWVRRRLKVVVVHNSQLLA